jgi:serine/threonine protein phosphatase 1
MKLNSVIKAPTGVWVIGDVHGEYKKLTKLLAKLPMDALVCFVGDLVDRGNDSAKVLELVSKNSNYLCVKGNHEELMIKALENNDYMFWYRNGGKNTIKSHENEELDINNYIQFLKDLPIFLYFEVQNHNPLVVSHSYIHNVWRGKDYNYSKDDIKKILWQRTYDENIFNSALEKYSGIFNIFGHSIIKDSKITKYYANIDTGACYKEFGKLTALHYPSNKLIQS